MTCSGVSSLMLRSYDVLKPLTPRTYSTIWPLGSRKRLNTSIASRLNCGKK